VGYNSEAAFSRAIKKATGMAPGAWREKRRERGISSVNKRESGKRDKMARV